jgi:DoxX-like family
MTVAQIIDIVLYLVTGTFLVAGLINLSGGSFVRSIYRAGHYPSSFHRVVGAVELVVTALLAIPQTRIWGVISGGIIVFCSIVSLLRHGRYAYSVPAIILLVALVPATLARVGA